MHQNDMPSSTPKRAKNRRQGLALRVERRYAPDLARQAQALLCLLACPDGGAAAGQRNQDRERLDEVMPECEGDDHD